MPYDFRQVFSAKPLDAAAIANLPGNEPGAPLLLAPLIRQAGLESTRRPGTGTPVDGERAGPARLRLAANSALEALKSLGPQLTRSQRTSIRILEEYASKRATARGFERDAAFAEQSETLLPDRR